MLKSKLFATILMITLSFLMLAGCSTHIDPNPQGFYAGETLATSELDRLSSQIFTEHDTSIPFDNIFYWTESGSKIHLFSDCGHLKNSSGLRSGDESAIRLIKKSGMCSSCLKKAGKTDADFDFIGADITTATTEVTTEATTASTHPKVTEVPKPSYSVNYYTLFYWTESGSKYHLYRDCGHLKNSVSVLSGNKSKLIEAEKNGPCSTCLNKADLTLDEFLSMLNK